VQAEIAIKYAAAEQFTQALEIAKTIVDEKQKAWALTEIAGKYTEARQKPSQKDLVHLSEILQTVHPMNSFWQ
jgi:hypothetical protein